MRPLRFTELWPRTYCFSLLFSVRVIRLALAHTAHSRSRLRRSTCDSSRLSAIHPLPTNPTYLSLRAAKGTRTRLAPSPPQSPASSPRPSAVPTLSGLIGDLGASTHPSHFLQYCIRLSYPDLYKTRSDHNHPISSRYILTGLSTILTYYLAMATRLMVSRFL